MSSSDTSASVRLTGRVKWFNNKTGFGFITIVGGDDQFKDASEIFAHHSAINVSQIPTFPKISHIRFYHFSRNRVK